ncbi:MAG: type III PLP-dependent enzyme [Chloroflexota bacterium]|nr:type III PLP-dependent enzyme [Chloroflexota bacterium]
MFEKISRSAEIPTLIINRGVIKHKYHEFHDRFSRAKIYYALKANPHPEIVRVLHECGCAFEISSQGELELLLKLKISPSEIISGNPIKEQSFIKLAHAHGIELFTFDSYAEVAKLSQFAPGSKVCVRLAVSNEGSEWPLSNKFGVDMEEAVELLINAQEKGLTPYGIAFHVGSQCTNAQAWDSAIEKSKMVWELVKDIGIRLYMLNIGGGFPVKYTKPVPSLEEIAQVIADSVRKNFPDDIELVVTPGRALVGEAGTLVATVIAKAARDGQKWLYLNVGVFNGLMESIGGIKYPIATVEYDPNVSRGNDGISKWTLAGPSCDSFDVMSTEVELPDLDIEERIHIMSAGAYTTAYASEFDGFPIPITHFVD